MNEPLLTDEAMADLEEIWCFIAGRRDESTADRIASTILGKCRSHARFPETGRSRDDLTPGLRSFPVSPYVVFYRPAKHTIQVVRILHGSRDTDSIMRSDLADS
jgi:toxin ParE1/3/4